MKYLKNFVLSAAALAAAVTSAMAGEWPEKPISLIVPFRAGGITDVVARKLEPGIAEALGQEVVVLNVAGHSSVGTRRVVDAAPDGYEFLVHETGLMAAEASGAQDFGHRDLKPVAAVATVCLVVVGKADSGWSSIKDIASSAGDKPLIAGVTIGGASHMGVLKAAELGGFNIRPVQVGGSADAYAALIGDQIDLMITVPTSARSYFYNEDGSKQAEPMATPLLYLGGERHAAIPDVDSMKDVGSDESLCIPNLVLAPKETPDEIVAKMASAIEVAYAQEDGLKAFFGGFGGTELFVAGDDLPTFMEENWNILESLAKASIE